MFAVLSTVILAAIAGTLLRWGLGSTLWGLLAINSAGSFLAGWVAGYQSLGPTLSTALLIGFCGSLTTFSGFALAGVRLLEQGEIFKFALHFTLNNAMCLSLCYGGWLFAKHT